jgi:iron complex outermembrane receptor protein
MNIATSSRQLSVKKFSLALLPLSVLLSMQSMAAAAVSTAESTNQTATEPTTDLGVLSAQTDSYRTTATKTALDPDDAPMSYSRIEQQTLKERQADSVSSALRYEPGVSTESRGTVSIFDEYEMRGFKNYSNFYDGMRLPYDGTWNLMPQVDAYTTEAVEVLKGPASSLYGYNEPGGMINQIAKTPKATQQTEIQLRVGSHNLGEIAVDTTGPMSDTLNYRFVGLARQKDGQMQTTEEKRVLLNPSIEWKPSNNVSVLANLYYQDDPDMLPSTPLPSVGTVYQASYGKLGADAYAGDKWNSFSKKVFMPSETINWQINDHLTFKHTLRYTDAEAQQQNTYHQGFAENSDRELIRTAYTTDESMTNWATDNQLAYQLYTDKTSHNLLFGVDFQHTKSNAKYADAMYQGIPTIDLAEPNYDLFAKQPINLTGYQQQDDITQRQLGVYLQDEMQWDKLTVVAGLRRDNFKSTTDSQAIGSDNKTTINKANETTGRLAGVYHFDNGFAPYISYSQSFQPLVGSNYLTGEPFKPTTANQFEVGVKYQSDDKNTSATLSAYDITKENEKITAIDWSKQTQTGEITSKGFEVAANHRLTDWLDIGLGYGYVDAEISKDEYNPQLVGNMPQQVAKHKASLWANITPTDKTSVNIGVRHHAGMQIDKENSDTLPSVTLVDLVGKYKINDTYSAGLNISNLFDKTYVGSCYDKNNCWMGPERQVSMSLTAKF